MHTAEEEEEEEKEECRSLVGKEMGEAVSEKVNQGDRDVCVRERKLGQGKVLIPEITHKVFYIQLIQQGTLKMTSVSLFRIADLQCVFTR